MTPPKWKKLADRLAKEISDGIWAPGTALPHIKDLATTGVGSKATVNRAYQDLKDRGLVVAARGRGTVVRELHPARVPLYRHDPRKPGGRARWESAVADAGLAGQVVTHSPDVLDSPPRVADALGLDAGAPVVRIQHQIRVGEDVIQRDATWYPRDLAEAAGLDSAQTRDADPLALLVRAGLLPGAREHLRAEVHTSISERWSDGRPELSGRGAVLRVDRVTQDSGGRAVEYVSTVADATRVHLSYSLRAHVDQDHLQ